MDIPDGIAVSADREWLAVSQAACGIVCVYPNSLSLGRESDPSAILRHVHYPHGLQFSACNRFLFVADAGRPQLLVFKRPVGGWYGVLHPEVIVEVMDEPRFLRGHSHPDEGGPKGLDVHRTSGIVAVTCEYQTLAFFDVSGILAGLDRGDSRSASGFVSFAARAPATPANGLIENRADRDRADAEVAYELHMLGNAREAVAAGIADIKRTRSWRITAPLRKLSQRLNKV